MFLDVNLKRNKSLVNEVRNFLIGVRLGFQPSTGASSWGGGKVDQERFVVGFRLLKRCVRVLDPIDEHSSLLHLVLNISLSGVGNDYGAGSGFVQINQFQAVPYFEFSGRLCDTSAVPSAVRVFQFFINRSAR